MKLSDCNTTGDFRKYVGKSTSWKKALRASRRKWKKQIGTPADECGFCYVSQNIVFSFLSCHVCPVRVICSVDLQWQDKDVRATLNSSKLKTLIANSKPGQIFTSGEKI